MYYYFYIYSYSIVFVKSFSILCVFVFVVPQFQCDHLRHNQNYEVFCAKRGGSGLGLLMLPVDCRDVDPQ